MKETILLMFLSYIFGMFVGATLVGDSDKLNEQYEQCLNNIPRNKYCKFVSANFEIVDKE